MCGLNCEFLVVEISSNEKDFNLQACSYLLFSSARFFCNGEGGGGWLWKVLLEDQVSRVVWGHPHPES